MEELLDWLESIHPLSEQLREELVLNFHYKEVAEKEFLLKAGHICRHIYFIEKGSFRTFYIHNDQEINSAFHLEGDIVTDFFGFLFRNQNDENIQALKNSKVYYFSFELLNRLIKTYPEFLYIASKVLLKHYGFSLLYLRCLRLPNKQERYYYTRMHFREIFDNVFQKDLAAFLGLQTSYISNFKSEDEKRRKGAGNKMKR